MSEATVARKLRVLIVEDEWLIADNIAEDLQRLGYNVVGPASSVQSALEFVEKEKIDAGLLDFRLINETSEAIADEFARRGVPFAFLTGYSALELPRHLRDSLVLSKPVAPPEIASALEMLIGERV
jgi:two-component system, response regulator PdtaR